MDNNELYHYGVLGMRWGIRRTPAQLGHKTTNKKKKPLSLFGKKKKRNTKKNKNNNVDTKPKKKKVSEMSDEELQTRINRMRLEQTYKQLQLDTGKKSSFSGKNFVMNVLEKSGEQMATQVVNELSAKAINKAFGYEAVYANNKKKS